MICADTSIQMPRIGSANIRQGAECRVLPGRRVFTLRNGHCLGTRGASLSAKFRLDFCNRKSAPQAAASGSACARPGKCACDPSRKRLSAPLAMVSGGSPESMVVRVDLDELVEHGTLLDDKRDLVAGKRGPTRRGRCTGAPCRPR
jgi:hypothetical protein